MCGSEDTKELASEHLKQVHNVVVGGKYVCNGV